MTMNDAFQTTSLVGQHLTQNRLGGLGTDMSGVGNALAMFDGGMFDKNFSADRALAAVTGFPGSASSALADAGWGGNAADAMAYAPVTKALPGLRPVAVAAEQGLFITSGASFAREGARTDAPGFKSNTVNVLAGYDRRITDSLVAGVFGGYALTRGDIDNVGSHTKISTGTIGGYGTYQAPGWFATAMGLYGFSDYDTTRVAVGTANTAAFSGDHYAIRGTVGTDLRVSGWVVTPEIGLQYTRVMTDGFAERGGAAALVVGSDSSESLRSSVGARFAYDYALNGGVLTPELRLAWLHEFSDGVRGINASFADTTLPGSFITATGSALRDRGVIGAGLSGKLAPLTVLSVNYDAIVGSNDAVAHQVMGRIRHSF
jgi:outer membrane autotransporter protein